jgi:pantetheine-phosphate adenylyltransferase
MRLKKQNSNNASKTSKIIAVYPGTFDPITLGHLDVVVSAMSVCDELIIAIANDSPKNTLFSLKERVEFVKSDIKTLYPKFANKIKVEGFEGLLISYAKKKNAKVIIRGLRAVSDFEYEFQLAAMNKRLNKDIQTIFIPAAEDTQFIASHLVKEVARLKGEISEFVSANTAKALRKKFK